MQVTVENVSELGRRMTVTVEDANIEKVVEQRLKSMRPKVKMAGFRPGKVPMSVLARTHGDSARGEAIDTIIQQSMQEAFTKEGVNPASRPQIESIDEKGEHFVYSLTYEVFPELKAIVLDGIEVTKTVAEVTDEDVDNMIETLREQRSTLDPLKRGAKEGDTLTIDFVGKIDNEAFPGGTGQDLQLELGAGNMLPEFEAPLIDKKADQQVDFSLTFPEDYRVENLRGKEAHFDVTIKQVAKKKLPKLDKEFAAVCGVEAGVAALKKEVRNNMARELDSALKSKNKSIVLDAVADKNAIELPAEPVQREAEYLAEQAKNNLRGQGINVEGLPFDIENFKPNAEKRVRLSLLVGKVIEDNKIEADEKSIQAALDMIASSYEDSKEVIDYYRADAQRMSELRMSVVEDKVVEWVLDHVKVTESASTFTEVVNPSAA